ncbi:Cytoplasmic tRNA 2-thiolation protein 2 [Habropoda laboriosa]|uniref:Cytoplasmic tRNA 2-thiolation protein 2 n=1 Tax=Habropoda laboriosa TaxID=597456 RepID=A0A0L7QXT9_9HYME|nr:PREDICTED: cytoplasmic tRNA 2-thiolation protein 2 [Habropoda laboriosa]KOC63349.1 Cytoplasmic tRNA 2-thiolation protein 2 [Habropoda laboriosa]
MCTLGTSEYDDDTFQIEEISKNAKVASCVTDSTRTSNTNPLCKKCRYQQVQLVLRNKNQYCRMCFLTMLMHKFKATLGKSKLVRPNDSILIAHSGKANSTALVHLVSSDAYESISKKLRLQCKVLYIDDGMVKGHTVEEREFVRNALAKEAERLRSTMYVVPLTKCLTDVIYEDIQSVSVPQMSIAIEDTVLAETFDTLENDTAKDELLRQLKRKLLVSAARKLNCNKVFIADTSVDLAIKVLGDVSTGRGSQLPFNVAFSDVRHADVMLLRPLRDFTGDEVIAYLDSFKLCPVLNSQKSNFSFPLSIRNIARGFVHQLDSEFYGTVSTIYRTSEKLATKIDELNSVNINMGIDASTDANTDADTNVNNICILCELNLESRLPSEEQLSMVQAKLFSKFISTITVPSSDAILDSLNICEQTDSAQIKTRNTLKRKTCQCHSIACDSPKEQSKIEKYLCYSCRLIFLDSKQMCTTLPNFILTAIEKKLQIACLRKEIKDFLL